MKRKLKGLLSLWLAVMMLLSMTSVISFAEGDTDSNEPSTDAYSILLYTGTSELVVDEGFTGADVDASYIESIDNFELDVPINEQVEVMGKLPEEPDDKILDGWKLWKCDNIGSGSYYIKSPSEKAADGTVTSDEYNDSQLLEPVWAAACTITFDTNGGEGTMDSVKVKKDSEYTLPVCDFTAPDDKKFDAWEVDGEEYSEGYKIIITDNTTVKATWKDKESAKVATPVFSPDGGKFTTSTLDVTITCSTPGATIYYTTNGDTPTTASTEYNGRVVVKADTTLKAIAVKDGKTSAVASAYFDKQVSGNSGNSGGSSYSSSTTRSYTVKFDTNGGLSVASQYVIKNKTVTEPTNVTKYGYTFEGWYTDEAFTTKYDFTTPVTSSFTLYAKWSGGTDSSDSTGAAADNRIILTIGQYKMQVFGKTVEMDVVPQIVNDRTMLPARFVAEALGADVFWSETEPDKVRIIKDSTEIIIYIGSDTAYVNGEAVTLDSTAFLENDRTYVPVRFICENLGATVDWEEGEQQVIIIVNN